MEINIYLIIVRCLMLINLFLISCSSAPELTYEGEKNQEGNYDGKGLISISNGQKWEGQFKDGLPYGQATITFPDGTKYSGEYKNGIPEGEIRIIFPDGTKYTGEYKNGMATYWYKDGQKMYEGRFKDGKQDGKWTGWYRNGQKMYEKVFRDGKIVQWEYF